MSTSSPSLEEQVRAALRGLAAMEAPVDMDAAEARLRTEVGHRAFRRGPAALAVAASIVTMAIVVGYFVSHILAEHRSEPATRLPTPSAPTSKQALPASLPAIKAAGTTPLGLDPARTVSLAAGFGSVWATDGVRIQVVDENSGTPGRSLAVPAVQIVAGADAMYAVANQASGGGRLVRIDPVTHATRTIHTYALDVDGLAVQGSTAFVLVPTVPASLVAVDVRTGATRSALLPSALVPEGGFNVAAGYGAVWVCAGQRLARIDPVTLRVLAAYPIALTGPAPDDAKSVFVGDGRLWLANDNTTGSGAVWEVAPSSGRVIAATEGESAQLAFSPGAVWTASREGARRFDVSSGRFTAVARLLTHISGLPPTVGVVVAGRYLWVADPGSIDRFVLP